MNRVRIVALAAVALGAAVTFGTKFQQARETAVIGTGEPATQVAAAPSAPSAPTTRPTELASAEPLATERNGTSLSLIGDRPATNATTNSGGNPSIAAPRAPETTVAQAPAEPLRPGLTQASVLPGVEAPAAPQPTAPELPLATMPSGPSAVQSAEATQGDSVQPLDPELQAELEACAVWLVVTPAPSAMLETSVYAPCDGGAQVSISHAALSFDTHLGEDGQLLVQLPALTEEAEVSITLTDGRSQTDRTRVTDLANVERIVLEWHSPVELELNAYEFGAGYGDRGHVSPRDPRQPGVDGEGFVTVLGDPTIPGAALAQVYSYPMGQNPRSGSVALEIEVPVSEGSCGQSLTANTIELHGTGVAQVRQIQMVLPECDGIGGFVVLPGVLPELTIAMN